MKRPLFLAAAVCLALSACGDDPFLVRWAENPQEEVLFTLDREELNTPSGFDMLTRTPVVLEDPTTEGEWDFAVERRGSEMVLLPPGALGVASRAAVAPLPGTTFEDVRRAPSDTLLYVTDEPVSVHQGTIYVVRTHQRLGSFGRVCVYYGKVQPLEIDLQSGVFRFLHDTSPDCNNRSLVPPS